MKPPDDSLPKKAPEEANKSLDRNFAKFMLAEIEARRKLLRPEVYKRKKEASKD